MIISGLKTMSRENNSPSPSGGTSAVNLFLGLASVGAGAYHGYCDAQGIPLPKENLEWALTYGPAIVRGSLGAVFGGIAGLVAGGVGGGVIGAGVSRRSVYGAVAGASGGAVAGTVLGAGLGGGLCAAVGAVQTLVGYGIGYLAGYATK